MSNDDGDHGDHGPNGAYSEVFEEADARPAQTVHRIRANSTIMQLKKILGVSITLPPLSAGPAVEGFLADLRPSC